MNKISRRSFFKQGLAAGLSLGAMMSPVTALAGVKRPKERKKIKAKRVLIMTFDGISIEGFQAARTPNLDELMRRGSTSLATRDVMPSITLPNYTSHLLGAGPEVHGVTSNSWCVDNYKIPAVERDADGYFPSVFQVLKDNVPGIKTAFFLDWKKLIAPYNPKVFDKVEYEENHNRFADLYDKAMEYLKEIKDEKSFTFLYTVHTDSIGHMYSWMSPEYIKAIEDCDAQVGRMIEMLKNEGMYEDTYIMFISDHGGIGLGHGGVSEVEMIVPWIIAGPGIKENFMITEANNTVNTASTVLDLFGVKQPLCWTGEVPMSIYK